MAKIEHILATTDFSPAAEPGIDEAVDLARRVGARLTLVHVFDAAALAPIATRGDIALSQYVNEQEVERAARDALDTLGRRKLAGLAGAGVELLGGHRVVDAIDDFVQRNGVDLIVISTHGRSGLAHMLIGSVAERLVRHARCPVLSVPSASAI